MPWKLRKEPEKNRIVVAVTGDELTSIIPDEVMELAEEIGDRYAKDAIEAMEKGVFEFYLPITGTKIEGF